MMLVSYEIPQLIEDFDLSEMPRPYKCLVCILHIENEMDNLIILCVTRDICVFVVCAVVPVISLGSTYSLLNREVWRRRPV